MAKPQRAESVNKTPRQKWIAALKWAGIVVVTLGVIGAGSFAALYVATPIPDPNKDFQTNVSQLYYRDGKTQLGSFAVHNRASIPLSEMPAAAKDSIVAAENETFSTDPGVSVTGLMRAVVSAIGPGNTVGGSTITQQYVKVLYLTQDKTLTRKLKEIMIALKVGQEQSKEQILEGYLNTVYFGRGAYGIQAASKAFFDIDAKNMSTAQSVALVAMINDPGRLDPNTGEKQKADLLERYQYSLNQLVKVGKLTEAEKATMYTALPVFPKINRDSRFAGPTGFLMRMASDELKAAGFTEGQINGGGLQIVTTIDSRMQEAVVKTAQDAQQRAAGKQDPASLHPAIASVDTTSGAILSLYGGPNYVENQRNWATTQRPTGSTFKTWAVVAALRNGITLNDTFAGRTLLSATTNSVNPSFLELTKAIPDGPNQVVKAALDAGLPKNSSFDPQASIALGFSEVSPVNAAAAYGTLANRGKQIKPFIVAEVRDAQGAVIYKPAVATPQTIEPDIANDTVYALTHVANEGTGRVVSGLGYPVAGKTGTRYIDAKTGTTASWFVGFTQQISTAVMFVAGDDGNANLDVYSSGFYGSGYPAQTWLAYMKLAMQGLPKTDFAPPTNRVSSQTPSVLPPTAPPEEQPKQKPTQAATSVAPTSVATSAPPTVDPTTAPTDQPGNGNGNGNGNTKPTNPPAGGKTP